VPLHYAGIRVTRLDRSLRFYTKTLRLREVRRGDLRGDGVGIWVLLEDPKSKQRLELNWYPKGSYFATPFRLGEGLDHLGFWLGRVPRAVLEREYKRLLRQGARPTEIPPEKTDGWVAYVTDPDGHWIEIFRWPTPAEQRAADAAKKTKPTAKPKRRRTG
jgi:catechol 2,3-dioxygenase-like lactoylglutathione lyase family enzyme